MANRKQTQKRARKDVEELEAEGSSVGVAAAPTAQLAISNIAQELQMCKQKLEWQKEKIEELTKERDFLKEQLASALKREEPRAAAGSSTVRTLDSSSEMSSKSSDSESSNTSSSSEDKKKRKKGKWRKKASKSKIEKTLQSARKPEQVLARYKTILKHVGGIQTGDEEIIEAVNQLKTSGKLLPLKKK